MGLFDGQVVIVTGAGGGIGRATAMAFAREGARVVVNDPGVARDGAHNAAPMAEQVVREILAANGEAIASTASVADVDGADSIVWSALNKWNRVDVLVNNAGILRDRGLLNMSEADFDAVIAVHLKGSFLMTRAFARALKATRAPRGAIVNTTSMSGLIGNFGQSNYSSAKAGIFGLTRTSALELAKLQCRVNAIAPVAVTRMTNDLAAMQGVDADALSPEHVAPVTLWLASALADNINGRVFGVHGAKVFEYAMQTSDGVSADVPWTPQRLQAEIGNIEVKS